MLPLRFVPYHALGDEPNVVVDGSPTASTVLTLSHWPGAPTPPELRDDLSAQIAFRALGRRALFDGVHAVSNNHFDQDGLAAVYALVQPSQAIARRELVVDVARAGDFGTFASRDAARLAMAIAALEDPDRTSLDPAALEGPYPVVCGRLYEEVLPRFTEALDDPGVWRTLWEDEDAHLGASLDAIASGAVRVDERRDLDLAIVQIPEGWADRVASRFTMQRSAPLHPMAVNRSTDLLRVLTLHGGRAQLELRYESWVMFTSAAAAPRPDLGPLAAELDALEPGTARWRADPPASLTPVLTTIGDAGSDLSPTVIRTTVERYLAHAPAAWDPFAGVPPRRALQRTDPPNPRTAGAARA